MKAEWTRSHTPQEEIEFPFKAAAAPRCEDYAKPVYYGLAVGLANAYSHLGLVGKEYARSINEKAWRLAKDDYAKRP